MDLSFLSITVATILLARYLRADNLKRLILFIFSLYFVYHFWGLWTVYLAGFALILVMQSYGGRKGERRLLVGLATLGVLLWYAQAKYRVFGGLSWRLGHQGVLVGASYLLVRSLILLKDGDQGAPLSDRMGYLFFAPTFLMGPLQKPSDYRNPTTFVPLAQCLPLFGRALWGALKLLVISANLAPYALDFDKVTWFGLPYANLLASLCLYSIYLYANFSGAIDIVIAVSAFMGWLLPENFRRPFLSRNINEFWKRWHISLTDLIRAYVFKPFVTRFPSEKGTWRRLFISCCGIVLAFVLSALWHGFSLMFLLWGLWHALGMIIHALYQKMRPNAKPKRILIPLQVAGTFLFVSIGWLFFTYPTVGTVEKAVHYGDFSAALREAPLPTDPSTLLVRYWGPPESYAKGHYSVGAGVKGAIETTPINGRGFLEIPMPDYSSSGKEKVSISLEFFDESGGKLYGYTAIADKTR